MTKLIASLGPVPRLRAGLRRRRGPLLVLLLAVVAAAAAGWVTTVALARVAALEDGLRRALAASGAEVPPGEGTPDLARHVADLGEEAGRLRELPARLDAEVLRRRELEGEAAAARDELAARTRELDELRARLGEAGGDAAAVLRRWSAEKERAAATRQALGNDGRTARAASEAEVGGERHQPQAGTADPGRARGETAEARRTAVDRDRASVAEEAGRAADEAAEAERARGGTGALAGRLESPPGELARAGQAASDEGSSDAPGSRDAAPAAGETKAPRTGSSVSAAGPGATGPAEVEVERLNAALADTRARLRAAEARADDLGSTDSDLDEIRPGARLGADGGDPRSTAEPASPPGAGPPAAAAARTLAAFRETVGGDGRFEFVEDNRIVVRSSAIFPTGEADISRDGRATLDALAERLRRAMAEVPPGTPWALRVDGHADDRPTGEDSAFASNWDLSAARASAVVNQLVADGIPAERLVVAAFGETRPLAPGTDEEARARNRRIEVRFVTR